MMIKKLLCLFAFLILLSFKGTDSDCDNIAKILCDPRFEKCFSVGKRRNDNVTIYVTGSSDTKKMSLCKSFLYTSGQQILFAKADFEVKIDKTSRGALVNPRIVVWKDKGQYHFFETETNKTFTASVKKGKVQVTGTGAF